MSSITWTPAAVASEARPYRARVWRSVEAQHAAATMKITRSLEEQRVVEDIIEGVKPELPPGLERLHYLLATPFRYRPYARGSRFRPRGDPRGVFYAAERGRTALAERAFYLLLNLAESVSDRPPRWAGQVTVFAVPVATDRAVDLTSPPFDRDRALWTRPADHGPCQAFAMTARDAGVAAIRYCSARDPEGGANLALLTPSGFAASRPERTQTWQLAADARGVRAVEDLTRQSLAFPSAAFAADPRLAPLEGLAG
jgi:RES domain